MKAAIIYHSVTGHTKELAELIQQGMAEENVEAKTFSIDDVDADWIKESQCVIIGSPTYYTDSTAKIKEFMEGMKAYGLAGKLGGAFASAKFVYGGGEMALQTILTHMLFFGMMVYSSGSSAKPPIHMGPVAIDGIPETKEIFAEYGRRMAKQAKQIF